MHNTFPEELDIPAYVKLNPDLSKANLSKEKLIEHFHLYGKNEGRVSNSIHTRIEFIKLIPKSASTLEIGPFFSPVIKGEKVKYFDVLTTEQLIRRAKDLNGNIENVPHIHYVQPEGDLDIIDEQFDIIISSHSIEHQPDLIDHLQKVERLLKPGGFYFCLIPDKRYCFDHFIPETTIADVVSKHRNRLRVHSFKSVVEHLCLTTHNDATRHWKGDHGTYCADFDNRYQKAVALYESANGAYIDVHASYFTPSSFSELMARLNEVAFTNLSVVRNYHTRLNQLEFYVIMQKIK